MSESQKFSEKLAKEFDSNDNGISEVKNSEEKCKGLENNQEEIDKYWNWEYSNNDRNDEDDA